MTKQAAQAEPLSTTPVGQDTPPQEDATAATSTQTGRMLSQRDLLVALHREMVRQRQAIETLVARDRAETPDREEESASARIDALTESHRTLEAYLSVGFFDRVKGAIDDRAEHLRPRRLERRLSATMFGLLGVSLLQVATFGLLAWLNWPRLEPLITTAWLSTRSWAASFLP